MKRKIDISLTSAMPHETMVAMVMLGKNTIAENTLVISDYEQQGYVVKKDSTGLASVRIGSPPYPDNEVYGFSQKQLSFLEQYLIQYEGTLPKEKRIFTDESMLHNKRKAFTQQLLNEPEFYSKMQREVAARMLEYQLLKTEINKGATNIINVGDKLFPLSEMLSVAHPKINIYEASFAKATRDEKKGLLKAVLEKNVQQLEAREVGVRPISLGKVKRFNYDPRSQDITSVLVPDKINPQQICVFNIAAVRGAISTDLPDHLLQAADNFASVCQLGSTVLHRYPKVERTGLKTFEDGLAIKSTVVGKLEVAQQVDFPSAKIGDEAIAVARLTTLEKREVHVGVAGAAERANVLAGVLSKRNNGQYEIPFGR